MLEMGVRTRCKYCKINSELTSVPLIGNGRRVPREPADSKGCGLCQKYLHTPCTTVFK